METYISKSPDFPEYIRVILQRNTPVSVSGRPLSIFRLYCEDLFFDDCPYVEDVSLFVSTAIMKTIDTLTHPHVPVAYTGTYPVVCGFSAINGSEYIFGVREELDFRITPTTKF